ncbi:MAG TPA: sigma-70 family RNA polymerase sigma factor [Candidatus Eisenbacteria bacterium]|nr:sigma-70 family RNA polymerase sigma factor [Candidatus Eisenbacteria bacterium]
MAGDDRGRSDARDPDDTPSVELVRRAQAGDRRALDQLFQRYLPILRRWATGRLPRWARDLVDTDDMIQDALIRTFNNLEGFVPRHDGAFGAYVRQALLNRIRDEVRKAQARPLRADLSSQHAADGASPLEEAIGKDQLERYERALARLQPAEREAVLARIEMGLSYQQIATAGDRPSAEAARKAVSRALLKLATELADE